MGYSDAVFQSRKEKNVSRMIDAMRGLEKSVSSSYDTPKGQFGRVVKITTGGLTIDNTLDIEFTVPFDDNTEANEAEIKVYNLSKDTVSRLKIDQEISITAGYGKDTGVIFSGVISTVRTKWSGQDKVTTITAIDSQALKEQDVESISFKAGVKASYILETLVGKLGLPVAVFQTRRDYTYTDAVTVSGGLMSAIKQYAEVCGVSAYINKQQVYVRHLTEGDNLGFTVDVDTGLLESPEEFTEETDTEEYYDRVSGLKFKMLLEHRMTTAGIVTVKSRNYSGEFRAREGKHVCTENDFYTEVTAIASSSTWGGGSGSLFKKVNLEVSETTQFTDGYISNSSRRRVGSSHWGGDNYVNGVYVPPYNFYEMWLRYKIVMPTKCKKIDFSFSYAKPMNSAEIVGKANYHYGVGTSSAPGSSSKKFKWDTSGKKMSGSVSGNFTEGQTVYLWLSYNFTGSINCYVEGVKLTSLTGQAG